MPSFLKFIFGIKLRVSDSSSVHRQEFFAVHTAVVYMYVIQQKTPDDGQRNCLEYVVLFQK